MPHQINQNRYTNGRAEAQVIATDVLFDLEEVMSGVE